MDIIVVLQYYNRIELVEIMLHSNTASVSVCVCVHDSTD